MAEARPEMRTSQFIVQPVSHDVIAAGKPTDSGFPGDVLSSH